MGMGGGKWDEVGIVGSAFMDPELLPLPMHMLYHLCSAGGAEPSPGVTRVVGPSTHWKGPLSGAGEAGHTAQARRSA